MNCFDRIHQLSMELRNAKEAFVQSAARNAQLNNEVALLRSQLSDARKQLEADSATISKLSADKRELVSALQDVPAALRELFEAEDDGPLDLLRANLDSAMRNAAEVLSRHA